MADPYVIVGAGQAGRRAAETLRSLCADIDVVLIGDEPEIPYDRPLLSKAGLVDEASLQPAFVSPRDAYNAARVELRTGCRVMAIERPRRRLLLSTNEHVRYEKLLLATGSRARRLQIPGAEGPAIHHLRTVADARSLRAALFRGVRATIIGGGFIGLEVAATLREQFDANVTVLESADRLLARVMPPLVSEAVAARHTRAGVRLCLGVRDLQLQSSQRGALVQCSHGVFDSDIVLVAIGSEPNTELAAAAGLAVDNGIVVTSVGETDDPSIYAAGDVTRHYHPWLQRSVRSESWQVAEYQAPAAARRMIGGTDPFDDVPWLWSDQYDLNLQLLGDPGAVCEWVMRGELQSLSWSAIGLDARSRPLCVVGCNAGREMSLYRKLLSSGPQLAAAQLADPATSLRSLCVT